MTTGAGSGNRLWRYTALLQSLGKVVRCEPGTSSVFDPKPEGIEEYESLAALSEGTPGHQSILNIGGDNIGL